MTDPTDDTPDLARAVEARMLRLTRRVGDCLLWTGSVNHAGYGRITLERKMVSVHRVAHEVWIGPIPDGLEIDHLCGVRNCIEPTHLEAVTHQENLIRSLGPTGINSRQVTCMRGHSLPPYEPGRHRNCYECKARKVPCPYCGEVMSASSQKRHIGRRHDDIGQESA